MATRRLVRIGIYTSLLTVTALLAAWLGNSYGEWLEFRRFDQEQVESVRTSIRGIEIGGPLPADLVLWSPDGSESAYVRDLSMPEGFVFYLGAEFGLECEALIDTLCQIRCDFYPALNLYFIVNYQPDYLLPNVRGLGVEAPFYWDMQNSLREDYGLPKRRVYLRIDETGNVSHYGRFFNTYDGLKGILDK